MEKEEFFVKDNDIVSMIVYGQEFKFRRVNSGDELDWIDDYTYEVTIKDDNGKDIKVMKQDKKKLALCKLRNIIEIPFNKEEIKSICGIEKDYKDFTDADKNALFSMMNPDVMSELIKQIDLTRRNKKKT